LASNRLPHRRPIAALTFGAATPPRKGTGAMAPHDERFAGSAINHAREADAIRAIRRGNRRSCARKVRIFDKMALSSLAGRYNRFRRARKDEIRHPA
jgi:hypothetical protein